MTICHLDQQDDTTIYCNLDEPVAHPKDFTPYLIVLQKLNIVLPDDMVIAIDKDIDSDRGNAFTDWTKPTTVCCP